MKQMGGATAADVAPAAAAAAPAAEKPAAADGVSVKIKAPKSQALKGTPQLHDQGPAGYEALMAALVGNAAPAEPLPEVEGQVTSWYDRGVRLSGDEAEPPAEPPSVLQSTISEWEAIDSKQSGELKGEVAKLEAEFDQTQEAAAVKDLLIGTWKLVLAPRADRLRASGLAGKAAGNYARLVGQTQTFRKPDPMDILSGNGKKPFMEVSEVAINIVDGKSVASSLYGGFTLGALSSGKLDVVEYYANRAEGGAQLTADDGIAPNSWTCAHVGPTFRVCKLVDGSSRVYVRVDEEEAKAEMSRLAGLDVAVDKAAKVAWELEQAAKAKKSEEPEDDPNDTRPIWQKRIDKEDGVKRTKNGTPIINHGPVGGGGGGPKLQK